MNKIISLHSILVYSNIILWLVMLYTYYKIGNNMCISQSAITIGSLLFIITHFVLLDAKIHKNLLLEVLALVMIFHFQLRIITLNLLEDGDFMLGRVDISPEKFVVVLIVVVFLYLALWASLRFNHLPAYHHSPYAIKKKATSNILLLLYISLVLSVMSSLGIPGIEQLVKISSTFFFNIIYMIMLSIGYFMYRWKEEKGFYKRSFILFLIIYILIYTLLGRKSTIYSIVFALLFCMLVFNKAYIKIKYLVIGVLFTPAMVFMFTFSQFARSWGISIETMTVSEQLEIAQTVVDRMEGQERLKVLGPIFGRIGFLDFTTEMVVNREHLKNYLTFENYGKSLVDNLLTPGFDLYGMPRMSCVVSPSYEYKGTPSVAKYDLVNHYYSAGISLYGESYVLFGKYLSILFVFIIGWFIKWRYLHYCKEYSIPNMWMKIIILYMVYELLYSFGFDWVMIDLVALLINFYIFKKLVMEKINVRSV